MHIRSRPALLLLIAATTLSLLMLGRPAASQEAATKVAPTVETDQIPNPGDAADDIAIWVHPADRSLSTVIGTDKTEPGGGIAVYSVTGQQLYFYPDGSMNNVDLRYNFPLGGQPVALVGATNRSTDTLDFYKVEESDRSLIKVGSLSTSPAVSRGRGFAMYRSPDSGKYYAFVTDFRTNVVEQYELSGETGSVTGTLVRSFDNGNSSEGMVADDELKYLYVAEEEVGVWRYGAEPGAVAGRILIDSLVAAGGHLTDNVKGLAIYYASGGQGYFIAASQGASSFQVYGRADGAFVGEFAIGSGEDIDRVSGQDGIDVTNISLGNAFPQGVFISQDNLNPPANQNFKLVPWQSISLAMIPALIIDPAANPHQLPGPLGSPPPAPATSVAASPGAGGSSAQNSGRGGTSTGEIIVIGGFLLLIGSLLAGAGFSYFSGVIKQRRPPQ
jgi:myo-inositol-hexaphosphate 3-phosphohydrolase